MQPFSGSSSPVRIAYIASSKLTPIRAISATKTPRSMIGIRMDQLSLPKIGSHHEARGRLKVTANALRCAHGKSLACSLAFPTSRCFY